MFKIPEFEDDVPTSKYIDARPEKREKTKLSKSGTTLEKRTTNGIKLNGQLKRSINLKKKGNATSSNIKLSDNSHVNISDSHDNLNNNHKPGRFVLKPSIKDNEVPSVKKGKKMKKKNSKNKNKPQSTSNNQSTVTEVTNHSTVNGHNKVVKKQKLSDATSKETKKSECNSKYLKVNNLNADTINEMLINHGKNKITDPLKNDDQEHLLFNEEVESNVNKKEHTKQVKQSNIINHEIKKENNSIINKKKEKLKMILGMQSNRTSIQVRGNKLRERMLEKLKAAQFRYLNEKLYTSSGCEAQKLFQADPVAFETYHQGYRQQLSKWPVNPLDIIVQKISKLPKSALIADMGCGEGALSRRVPHAVRSFDLLAAAPGVEACDMAHTPLLAASMDVVVFCLALMGTELTQYLLEANRVLKQGGQLLIAEVESRFDDVDAFIRDVQRLGFKLQRSDRSHQVFLFLDFRKNQDPPAKKSKLPTLTLKPCLYKRR